MKRFIVFLISFIIVLTNMVPAISADSNGSDAVNNVKQLEQLVELGIFSKNAVGDMEAERSITREEFAKVLLSISGQEIKAELYKNNSTFKDVKSSRWSNGYIGAVNALGYLKAMPDGLFHPTDKVTYSQVATVFGKLLSYTDNDLSGNWPYNYLALMENLGMFEGISYKATDAVSRKYMAVMLNRLLQSEIKDGSKLFIETTGVFQNIIIFENSMIRKDLDPNRVLTDRGVFYLKSGTNIPAAGKKYIAKLEKGIITKLAMYEMEYVDLSVKSISAGVVLQNGGNETKLPQNIQYNYNGKNVEIETAIAAMNTNSSIIIGYRDGDAEYAVIFDPVYSEPLVMTSQILGYHAEQLYANKPITRGGKSITSAMLEVNDVVYEVTDIWKNNAYVEVYNNKVSGEITAILPSKVSPATISIAEKNYALSSFFPKEKINMTSTIEVDSKVDILLGLDGKAVDVFLSGAELNQEYVLVLNAYKESALYILDHNNPTYYVTVMHTDGSEKTYVTEDDKTSSKGTLAKYTIVSYGTEYDTIKLSSTEFTLDSYHDSYSTHEIKKDNRMLDNSYVLDNAVIFNQINNIDGHKNDASILEWEDLPDRKLEAGTVRYIHRTGDFGDIDILFVNNILEEQIAYGLVTKVGNTTHSILTGTTQTLEIMINAKQYTYSGPEQNVSTGTVLKLIMSGDKILSVEKQLTPTAYLTSIDAVDSTRIRYNGTTYNYHKNFVLYKLEQWVTWNAVDLSRLTKGSVSGTVRVYFDKDAEFGGKVVMILII